jgi:hypothetical protein
MQSVKQLSKMAKIQSFDQFLSEQYQIYHHRNDTEVIKQAASRAPKLIKKIESMRLRSLTEQERLENTTDDIIDRIGRDSLLRSFLRKDPSKQSIHENSQIELIKLYRYSDFRKLPGAKRGRYLHNGSIMTSNKRPSKSTKTLDIYSVSNNVYGILKHSSVAGGAQDNQFRDVQLFIHDVVLYFNKNPGALERFEFYLDGGYYTEAKYSELRDMIPENMLGRIVITSVDSIIPV